MKSGPAIAVYDVFMMSYVNNLLPGRRCSKPKQVRGVTCFTMPYQLWQSLMSYQMPYHNAETLSEMSSTSLTSERTGWESRKGSQGCRAEGMEPLCTCFATVRHISSLGISPLCT